MTTVRGSCLCGAVELVVREPQTLLECHCSRCRRWTGSASGPVVVVSSGDLEQPAGRDVLERYEEEGFSDRYFCGRCGSSVFSGGPDTFYVQAGLLEDLDMAVTCHIQVAEKAPWHEIGGGAPQHAAYP